MSKSVKYKEVTAQYYNDLSFCGAVDDSHFYSDATPMEYFEQFKDADEIQLIKSPKHEGDCRIAFYYLAKKEVHITCISEVFYSRMFLAGHPL